MNENEEVKPDSNNPSDDGTPTLIKKYEKNIEASEKKWKHVMQRIEANKALISVTSDWHNQSSVYDESAAKIATDSTANLIFASNKAQLPLLYARDPAISCVPELQVEPEPLPPEMQQIIDLAGVPIRTETDDYMDAQKLLRRIGKTTEIVLAKSNRLAKLQRVGRAAVRAAQVSKVGVIKFSFQQELGQDPIVLSRLNDAQDDLRRVQAGSQELQDSDDPEDTLTLSDEERAAKVQELGDLIEELQNQTEIVERRGMVYEQVPIQTVNMDAGTDLYNYMHSPWMSLKIYLTVDQVRVYYPDITDDEATGWTTYRRGKTGLYSANEQKLDTSANDAGIATVCLVEYYNRDNQTVYRWVMGADKWVTDPSSMPFQCDHWFPLAILGLNWTEGQEFPQSDVELLEKLQAQYNDVRNQQGEHIRMARPFLIGDTSLLKEAVQKAETISTVEGMNIVLMDLGGANIKDLFQENPGMNYQPGMYDTQPIRADIEWMSGTPEAARGGVSKAKTLGEAQMVEGHLANRTSDLQFEVEDVLNTLMQASAQIQWQALTIEQVKVIAGIGAAWPGDQSLTGVIESLNVQIKSGSVQKPDRHQERESWAELLPHVERYLDKIIQLEGLGGDASAYRKLLQITLDRWEEKLTIDELIPKGMAAMMPLLPGPGGEGEPGGLPGQEPQPIIQ